MADSFDSEDPEKTICFCHNVPLGRIRRAMEEEGAQSVEDIQRLTCASTGCGGCEMEVVAILNAPRS